MKYCVALGRKVGSVRKALLKMNPARGLRTSSSVLALASLLTFGGLVPGMAAPGVAASRADSNVVERTKEVEVSVPDFLARAIARSQLGRPGGLTVAIWEDLARGKSGTRYCSRYLTDRQVEFTSYGDFLRRFSSATTDPAIRTSRALLIIGHAGYGLGMQVSVQKPQDRRAIRVPQGVEYDREYAPLEFVSFSRVRLDLADKYDLIVLGQCNPRACLRFADKGIPVGDELYKQIDRLSDRPKQLTVVRNPTEDIYLVGKKVVHVQPYTAPNPDGVLPLVVAPDMIAEQAVNPKAEKSSQTDVFILAGLWTSEPTNRIAEGKIMRPSGEMIRRADALVQTMVVAERKAMNAEIARGQGTGRAAPRR